MRLPTIHCPTIRGWHAVALCTVAVVAVLSCGFMIVTARSAATERVAPERDYYFEFTLTDGASSDEFRLRPGAWQCEVDDYDGGSPSTGAWGGATVSLQYSIRGEWLSGNLPATLVSVTADTGAIGFEVPYRRETYRWLVSGGSSTDLFAFCGRVGP